LQAAEAAYREVLNGDPNHAQAWHCFGKLAHQAGDLEAANRCIARAIGLKPDYAEAHLDLGNVFKDQGRRDEALACYRKAVELKSDYAEAHCNIGLAAHDAGKFDEAVAHYRQAIGLKPDFAEAHYNLGNALQEFGDNDAALASYRRALGLKPEFAEAHNSLGVVYQQMGDLEQAATCYRRALELNAALADANCNYAQLLLLTGDFLPAWPRYELRWGRTGSQPRRFRQPQWDGGPLTGKTILLHAEQGLGDTIQFIRYVPLVKQLGARVILACQPELLPLLANYPGVDQLVGAEVGRLAFDVHAPLLSLPGIFKTTLDTIHAKSPYLAADPALVVQWRDKLSAIQGFRIGINYRGTPRLRQRDIPIDCFAKLGELPDVRLISLQKGRVGSAHATIVDLGPDFDTAHGAFMDTAAIMMNLDLVITSDTSIPHLAGALGVPVWVALPYIPDWRWLLDRADSPWYPTMRLFRQKQPGDWAGVFAEIEAALRELL